MLVPAFSSSPNVFTSLGEMTGYLFKLDPESTSSMVGAMVTFSNTDSRIGGLFFRSSYDADRKHFNTVTIGGVIKQVEKHLHCNR